MALVDDGLGVEERQDLATAVFREAEEWDGQGFPRIDVLRPNPYFASGNLYWALGPASMADFVAPESLNIFHLLGQQPGDLQWLSLPVAEWENDANYIEFKDYVKAKSVVNDPAERALGLIKRMVKTFKKEQNLQAAMVVTKKAREAWPTGSLKGKAKSNMTKKQLSKIKPSELLKRDEDIINVSTDDEEMEDAANDVLDI